MQQSELDFINNLRQATPYIEKHRGTTLVIYLPNALFHPLAEQRQTLLQFAKDVLLLNTLGMRTVITLGAELEINQQLQQQGFSWQKHLDVRITETTHLTAFKQAVNEVKTQIEAAFTQAAADLHASFNLVNGNWVIAKPKGVISGIDYQHTGSLRKVHAKALKGILENNQIALLTPLTYSLTGDVFNLNTLEQAFEVATSIEAEKLIVFSDATQLSSLPKELSLQATKTQIHQAEPAQKRLLELCLSTEQKVNRIHLLNQSEPSSMLLELFTLEGTGTLVFMDRYHQTRKAKIEDVGCILNLIAPLEEQGILVKRSREMLELEIDNFFVMQRDEHIIGCAALYPIDEEFAELACLAIDARYQKQSLGKELLNEIESSAKQQGIQTLCLLTTHTHHWFIENQFELTSISALPEKKQQLYNYQRQSKVLVKDLKNDR